MNLITMRFYFVFLDISRSIIFIYYEMSKQIITTSYFILQSLCESLHHYLLHGRQIMKSLVNCYYYFTNLIRGDQCFMGENDFSVNRLEYLDNLYSINKYRYEIKNSNGTYSNLRTLCDKNVDRDDQKITIMK